jgi:outer membrane protein TolC
MNKLLLTCMFFIFLGEDSFATDYNLKKHIELSVNNDPEFQAIISEKNKIKHIVDQGLPSRQVTLSISSENGYSSDSDQNTELISGELSKEIIESGTEFSIGHSKTVRPDRQEDVTQIRLEQSLYKNMFGRDVRLKKASLSEQEKIKALEITEAEENYFVAILKQYLELSKAFRDYKLSEKIHAESLKLKNNVESKVKSKIASKTDLNRSRLLVLLRQEEILKNKNIFETLKNQIEKSVSIEFKSFEVKDSDKLVKKLEDVAKKIVSPEWKATRASLIAHLRESSSSKEAKLLDRVNSPELNLVVGYNKDDSSRFSTVIKRNETVVGLRLEIPFGDTKSNADYQISKVDLLKSQIQRRVGAVNFDKAKKDLLNKLTQAREQLNIDSEKVKLTQMIIQEEEKRFSIGRLDLETLIQLKSDFATYRVNQEQSKLTYGQALIDWLALNDKLDRNNITNSL